MRHASTIAEYIIQKWLDERFRPGSLKVVFDGTTATIIDRIGQTATVRYENGMVFMEGEEKL
ncbi:MAG: hypothetical protein J6B85_05885 [Lachnospiraceae bacterium]|nr:hypothetical protein [Lachnospiraceae bacterium]